MLRQRFLTVLALLCLVLTAGLLFLTLPALAAGRVVNTAVDENDGECVTDCSLRDAIALAADGDTITFSGSYTIYLNSQLEVTKTLTIDGSGHAVKVSGDSLGDGSPNVRVFSIGSSGGVTLTHLNIISGTAPGVDGGGILNSIGSRLTVQNGTLSGNSAYNGGGIANWGTLTVQNSTLSGNSASASGGGILNTAWGPLTVQNSTLSGNSASTSGGGIYNWFTLNLSNTLIANSPSGGDCVGSVTTNDHNLIEGVGSTACGLANGAGGSVIGMDPLLAPLGDYGPSTSSGHTHALLPGSPAIGAGNNATCLSTDQRGVSRPQPGGGACDIGAFESRGFTLTVASGSGQTTTGNALFPNPLSLTVTSSSSEPVNGGQVVLTGPGSGAGIHPPVYTVTISSGAMTQVVRANATAGSYIVSADTRGNLNSAVSFSLTNLAPKMVVLGNGLVIPDNDTAPSTSDHTDLGSVTPGWAITRTFIISNSGWLSLTVNSLGLSGANASDFTLSGLTTPVTVALNNTRTFQVRFDPPILGTRAATVVITTTSDDGDQNAYDFAIQGTGVCANRMSVTNANDNGVGSLRQAIAFVCDGGVVDFAGDYTIYLNSQLEVTKTLTIDGSGHAVTISGDSLGDGSPNVRVFSIGSSGGVTLTHLNIISGTATGGGGGIYNGGKLTVQNSTLSGNSADNGGGIYNQSGNTLTVQNSTLSGNSASASGGGIYNNSGTLNPSNTLIANSPSGGDCVGSVTTNDHNLIEGVGSTACGLTNGAGGSLIGVNPLLAPLGDYGPSTSSGHTHALLPGSPAIGAGNNATCLPTDQRGVARPQPGGGACDIGAFESRGFTLTYGSGSGQSTPVHTLFPQPLSLTVTGSLSEPVHGGQVVLTGPGSGAGTNPPVYTATINSGVVTQTVRANSTAGSYTVSADMRGNLGNAASFSLTNLPLKTVVLGNGVVIADGDTTPSPTDSTGFGDVIMGEAIITHTFTISNNSSTASLIVNSLGLSGAAAGDFALSGLTTPVTLSANTTRTFQTRFAPTILGTRAATVVITTTSDDGPENAYDFAIQGVSARRLIVTNANDSGAGSLRQAIADAVDGDIINFAGNYTIYLSSTLVITERLTIDGSGRAITVSGDSLGDGSPNVQVFYIGSGVVTLTHLNIVSGTGSINGGGGIESWGRLTVQDCTLSGNSTTDLGGGILNQSTLAVISSTLSDNSALRGGGIVNIGNLTVQSSIFSGNSATTDDGGGIFNWGTLTVQNSTLSGNSASSGFGGGIFNDGNLTVQNSTFSGNSAWWSGGISSESGTLTVQNSTLSGNSATWGGGIYINGGTLNLSNTLIANNFWQECVNEGGVIGANSHNLIAGSWACGLVNSENGNLIGVDPLLAPLGNYGPSAPSAGQATLTFALLPGSPAIDAGNACLSADQRGVARPQVAACDIGAFESRGFTLTYGGGNSQSTPIHTLFAQPLSLTVTGNVSEPVDGGQVVLAGPSSGAGTNPPVYTATISGGAITQTVRANGAAGSYTVTADMPGRVGSAVSFSLTNLPLKTVVLSNSVVIADGDTTPSPADGTDLGNVIPSFAFTHTFTISNSSTASLTLYSLGLSGAGAGDFALSGPTLPVTLTANSAVTFQARFAPSIFATRTATITLASDDGPENDYDFAIQGVGVCADRISVTNANDSGAGSLRQALALVCDGGTVDFSADTTPYLDSQIELTRTVTIDGSGHTVKLSGDSLGDGSPNVRVLSIGSSGVVTLTHLTIVSGTANTEAGGYEGGGIRNTGRLILLDSTLSGNSATNYGGGIYNSGTLTMSDSIFSSNSAFGGGSVCNISGRLTILNSTFSSNSAFSGGGIYNESGLLALQNGTLTSNSANYGGGIHNNGTLTMQNSTLSGNSGSDSGGGIYNGGTLTVQNSTLSGNSAYNGGGIENGGTLTIQNSTLSGNSVGNTTDNYGGGIYNYGLLTLQNTTLSGNWGGIGGGIENGGTLNLRNTLIANSPSGGDCRIVGGSIAANDHNLMQSTLVTDTCGLSNGAGGSLIGVDPLLGPLADNGGPSAGQATWTHALLPGSPALDAGNNATCLSTDQRGVPRPQGAACDIGAYEVAKLGLAKFVTPDQAPYHSVVTYTLVLGLGQGDAPADTNIILTDTLPAQVVFGSWVISPANTVQAGNAITWTGALTAGNAITFTFTATHVDNVSGWVTNTAIFSGTTYAGSASAGFRVAPYVITPTAGTGGSITPGTPQAVEHGASITFTIAPTTGYHIADVGVDGTSVGAVTSYAFNNVTASHTLSAAFALNEYTLTVGVIGQGQVTRVPSQTTYLHGSIVTLTAMPEVGWSFGQWSGDASGVLTQTTVTMDANKAVTATFLVTPPSYYTLTMNLVGSGVITPTAGAHSYLAGTVVDLSASPAAGWRFAGWSGAVVTTTNPLTLTMDADKSVTATFVTHRVYLPMVTKP